MSLSKLYFYFDFNVPTILYRCFVTLFCIVFLIFPSIIVNIDNLTPVPC